MYDDCSLRKKWQKEKITGNKRLYYFLNKK